MSLVNSTIVKPRNELYFARNEAVKFKLRMTFCVKKFAKCDIYFLSRILKKIKATRKIHDKTCTSETYEGMYEALYATVCK